MYRGRHSRCIANYGHIRRAEGGIIVALANTESPGVERRYLSGGVDHDIEGHSTEAPWCCGWEKGTYVWLLIGQETVRDVHKTRARPVAYYRWRASAPADGGRQ